MTPRHVPEPTVMRVLGGLFGYVGTYTGRVVLAFLLSVTGVVVELLRPWPTQVAVDYVLLGREKPAWLDRLTHLLPGAGSDSGLLVWSVGVAVGVVVIGAVLSWLTMSVTVSVSQRMVYDLAMDLFAKLQRLSIAYHGRHPLGDLLQRVNQDVYVVYFVVANVTIPATVSLLALGGMFVVLARLDLGMALLALGIVPVLVASLSVFVKPMEETTERQYATQGAAMALMQQSLSAIKVVQAFAREALVQRKVELRAREMADAYGRAVRVSDAYAQVATAVTGVASAVMLGYGGFRVVGGHITVGELLVFIGYLAALYGPVNQLTAAAGYAAQMVGRGRRVFEILDAEEEVREKPDAVDLPRVRGEVTFEGITFGYRPRDGEDRQKPILRDVSFEAHPGQITAIVGSTGAGKTSLIGLLSRLYDPWEGRVLIDGHDIRDVSLASLRENVSIVLQEPFLFPMSIADNIGFGRPDASREEIEAAARAAHAHEFICRLPSGYDTEIGEHGASLSGGERQRIAIARAILKDAPILVLDEPTSALDARTESQIFEALAHLMRGKTAFIISHRLSTVRRADQILALERGTIAQRGTHDALLDEDGLYSRLYRHQYIAAV